MPFRSKRQRGFLYEHHPEIAARWEAETPKGADLPERVRAKKRKRTSPKTIGPAARRRW